MFKNILWQKSKNKELLSGNECQEMESLRMAFERNFGSEPVIVKAPATITLIGEHLDYNLGSVISAPIDFNLYVAVQKNGVDRIRVFSNGFGQHSYAINELKPVPGAWYSYIYGIVFMLQRHGYKPGGFDLMVSSEIPAGAGLSSSAALCCATALAINEIFSLKIKREELALIAQQAEHHFAKVNCGLSAQYTCLFGMADHLLMMNFNTTQYGHLEFELGKYELVLLDTGTRRQLLYTEYNSRIEECNRALEVIKKEYSVPSYLAEVHESQVQRALAGQHEELYHRAKFIVEEEERVYQAKTCILNKVIEHLGALMSASQEGLKEDFEVSTRELDFLSDACSRNKRILGAKITGAGFGGCLLLLIRKNSNSFLGKIRKVYQEKFGRPLSINKISIVDGARVLEEREAVNIMLPTGLTIDMGKM